MDIDVSSVTSHFTNPQDGSTTTTSGSVSSGAATVGLNSTGNYDNGDIVVLIIEPADANKKQVFVGTVDVSGSQLTNVIWVGGTNQAHGAGSTVVDYYDAAHIKMMTKGILVSHNQDGTLKNGAVSLAAMLGNNVVEEAKIKDNAVAASKLATNAIKLGSSSITADTGSLSNDTTTGLSVTVTIPSGGRSVRISAFCKGVQGSNANATYGLSIWDGTVGSGTQLASKEPTAHTNNAVVAADVAAIVTPAAGSKTYNVGMKAGAGTGILLASSTSPAYILVEVI